jgi:hypothetical protein
MKARAASVVVTLLLAAADASAGDDIVIDARMPLRFGFAYTGITRGPAMSFSWGGDVDVAHVTRRLTFQVVVDAEINSRLDLPDTNPASSFTGLGVGAGLFYVTEGRVGLGFESVASLVFDAKELVGGGLSTRAYVYPFYLGLHDAIEHKQGRVSSWVKSAIAIWVMARVDWAAADGRGATLAFGASFDLMRFFFLPYIDALDALKTKAR